MKSKISKKSRWQTIASVIVLAIFTYVAIASVSYDVTREILANGEHLMTQKYTDGSGRILTQGPVDSYNHFYGPCTIEIFDEFGKQSTEKCIMKSGWRHGVSVITYSNGVTVTDCYDNGLIVECDEKSAKTLAALSSYDVLSLQYPWYTNLLNAFGYDDYYMKSFMDTLETVIYAYEEADVLNESSFSTYIGDAMSDLSITPYDSVIQVNNWYSAVYGSGIIMSSEFRLATFDRYWSEDKDTYKIVKSKYPNYLLTMASFGVSENDFDLFCEQYDSLLNSYGELNENDDFFADSVDNRIYRALEFIFYQEDETSSSSLKSFNLNNFSAKKMDLRTLKPSHAFIQNFLLSLPPKEVVSRVLYIINSEYGRGDLILRAIFEAYNLKNGVIMLPTVTTDFIGNNSSTSATISGTIMNDGGGEVSERGVVWSTGYNPLLSDETIDAGSGAGEYEAVIQGLTEGETYFARSFATNSVGTAYGNNIEFTTGINVAINEMELEAVELLLYPNPAKENITLTFNLETTENFILNIVNVKGQVVLTKRYENLSLGKNRIDLNIAHFENGLYNCRITNNSTLNLSQKFLIAK
jgi:hypothetical protein